MTSPLQKLINHMVLVIDESSSIAYYKLTNQIIKVADDQIAYLARRSKELNQETRISVYVFGDKVRCLIYDTDVLRLPSIKDYYRPNGRTALIDGTLKALDDLALTPEIHGDHAFLAYVLTDGEENASRNTSTVLTARLNNLPEHWTVAVLVPSQQAKFEAKKFGFPADNIAIWDATTVQGVSEAGNTIQQSTDQFMTSRASGIRGTRSIFSMDSSVLNKQAVKAANLTPMPTNTYTILEVKEAAPIRDWVQKQGLQYLSGRAFYQLTKRETIQPQKQILIMEKTNNINITKLYSGDAARDILGLPMDEVRVSPNFNPNYEVFVQSTSVNRKLVPGTWLVLT